MHLQDIIDEPGDEKFEVVPGSDLRVARHANRQNASRYTINERLSNYTEVQKLLKGRGIDLDHKRFLILQGEVESIAQMKPKATNEHEEGLLEYLEDIIGTSQYVEQIEKAQAEMEQLTEEKAEMMTKLRRVEKEKDGLSKEKEEADSYLRLCNERTQARSVFLYYRAMETEGEAERCRQQMVRRIVPLVVDYLCFVTGQSRSEARV